MKKQGRNDPCICGSGKKFKKCCENQMLAGRFKASCLDAKSDPQIHKIAGLSSLFQTALAATPKKLYPSQMATASEGTSNAPQI
jgi:uncharacterized protein YecA (UPF0149 family)